MLARPRHIRARFRSHALLLLLLTAGVHTAQAQADQQSAVPEPEPDPIRVSVITFGRGGAVHQYFGHNAIVVEGPGVPESSVFNYGMFSFGPDMLPQFLRGRLKFWLGV